jgi:hypothetical protein
VQYPKVDDQLPNAPPPPQPKLRWYQFRLRTLLLFVLVASVGMSWFAVKLNQARRQRAIVEKIESMGGQVKYDFQYDPSGKNIDDAKPFAPFWLENLLGNDFFSNVIDITFLSRADDVTDSSIAEWSNLPRLLRLSLTDAHQVTDKGLKTIGEMEQLESLEITGIQFTNEGSIYLKGQKNLKSLVFGGDQITDKGLKFLHELTQLEELSVTGKCITDDGLVHLEGLLHLRSLSLLCNQISDEGLKHLKALNNLQSLSIYSNRITDQDLRLLGQMSQIKTLGICHATITDNGLKYLQGMNRLQCLILSPGKHITKSGIAEFHKYFPLTQIKFRYESIE